MEAPVCPILSSAMQLGALLLTAFLTNEQEIDTFTDYALEGTECLHKKCAWYADGKCVMTK